VAIYFEAKLHRRLDRSAVHQPIAEGFFALPTNGSGGEHKGIGLFGERDLGGPVKAGAKLTAAVVQIDDGFERAIVGIERETGPSHLSLNSSAAERLDFDGRGIADIDLGGFNSVNG